MLAADVWCHILQFLTPTTAVRISRANRLLHGLVEEHVLRQPRQCIRMCRYDLQLEIEPFEIVYPSNSEYRMCSGSISLDHHLCGSVDEVLGQLVMISFAFRASPPDHGPALGALGQLAPASQRYMARTARLVAASVVPLLCWVRRYEVNGGPTGCQTADSTLRPLHTVKTVRSRMLLIGYLRPCPPYSAPSPAEGAGPGIDVEGVLLGTVTPDETIPGARTPWGGESLEAMLNRVQETVQAAGDAAQLITIEQCTTLHYRRCLLGPRLG